MVQACIGVGVYIDFVSSIISLDVSAAITTASENSANLC
jgi:hypothetical protein